MSGFKVGRIDGTKSISRTSQQSLEVSRYSRRSCRCSKTDDQHSMDPTSYSCLVYLCSQVRTIPKNNKLWQSHSYPTCEPLTSMLSLTDSTNFVHFSSPNGASVSTPSSPTTDNQDQSSFNMTELPAWPSYLTGDIVKMSSTGVVKVADDYRKEQVDFLNSNEEMVSGY